MEKIKMNMVVSVIIFLAVIAVLVYITINRENPGTSPLVKGNMQNTQQSTQPVEGVKITVLKQGNGEVAKSGDTVAMNYTGKLADGTVFDSNVDPKFSYVDPGTKKEMHYLVPFIFTIDGGQVIKGWDVGVAGMKVGEKRTLEIAPEFAYGSTGAGGVIPPNATLIFEVELVAIKK